MSGNVFSQANFNPANAPVHDAVVFDAGGIIDDGGIGNAAQLGYTPSYLDMMIEYQWDGAGLGDYVWDVSAQVPGATYMVAVNSAVSVGNSTTYYVDHGLSGTAGNDVILDASGDNIISSGDGIDLIMTGGGSDLIDSGRGADIVMSGMGDDMVRAGAGNDVVFLWDGADLARGDGGHDEIHGGNGSDRIWGNGGRDSLFGDAGTDVLNGGGGADVLNGGADRDELTGGHGADTFVFGLGGAFDTITDFDTSRDVIELDMALGVSGFGDIAGLTTQNGGDLWIDFGGGDGLILEGITLADLSANDFVFV